MKTIRIALTSLLIAVAFLSITSSRAETTEEMLSACRPIVQAKISDGQITLPQDFEPGVCWGALETLDFMLMTINSETHKPVFAACVPENHTEPQIIAIFVRYAESHPARYAEDFELVAFAAEKDAFLCPAPRK